MADKKPPLLVIEDDPGLQAQLNGAKWTRELTALQRLVHASVAALQQGGAGAGDGADGV